MDHDRMEVDQLDQSEARCAIEKQLGEIAVELEGLRAEMEGKFQAIKPKIVKVAVGSKEIENAKGLGDFIKKATENIHGIMDYRNSSEDINHIVKKMKDRMKYQRKLRNRLADLDYQVQLRGGQGE